MPYFRTDTTRLTFRELWRISSTFPVFLAACVKKILRLRSPARHAILHEENVREIPFERISMEALDVLEPLVEECERLGARLAFCQTVYGSENLEAYSPVLLAPRGDAVIMLTWARASLTPSRKASHGCAVSSRLEDGTFLSTTNLRARFLTPPEYVVERRLHAGPAELLARHEETLAGVTSTPLPIRNENQAKDFLIAVKRRTFEWNVGRGIWVLLTPQEEDRLDLPAPPG